MAGRTALKLAIDLLHVPAQVRLIRSEPLPDGVVLLLRIAAAEVEAEREAVALTRRSPETIRRAATSWSTSSCPPGASCRRYARTAT